MASPWRKRRFAPIALSLMVGVGLAVATAAPGYAQPGEVPDSGARPVPAGQLPLPDGSFARPPTAGENLAGPLSAEIAALEIRISTLATERLAVEPAIGPAAAEVARTEQDWRSAGQQLTDAQTALDELVSDSYRGAAALPPELFIPELRGLSAHAPVPVEAPLGVAAAARKLVQLRSAEQAAADVYQTAQLTQQDLTRRQAEIDVELAALRPRLERLQDRNTELVAAEERAREAADQEQQFPVREPVAGFRAGPDAVRAVEYALAQLGKPYEWGAEGPNRFDCSGLVWAAYQQVRRTLPRVAADQYWGTRLRLVAHSSTVAQQGLLPGDLVFFASGPSWQSIHHVGMYVGNGFMVHAPNRNEVVKVSPVWWSRFFAATRVVDAVPVDGGPAPPPGPIPPGPGPGPDPEPGPTTPGVIRPTTPGPDLPGPDDTPDPPDPPDPTPSDPPSPSPSGSPSPTPGGSPSPTPSPEESPTPSPEESPSPSPETSPSPSPEGSPSPSPESSPSSDPTGTISPSPTAS